MRSLLYLLRKSIKNSLLELRRQPGKLISYLLVIGLLAFTALAGGHNLPVEDIAPRWILDGILFAVLCLFAVMAIHSGLSSGSTFFDMSDVNLLFVSPVSPRSILSYGIVKLAKLSFASCLFLLFQASTLRNFGVDYGGVLMLFGILILSNTVLTILSLLIYSRTNGHPRRRRAVVCCGVALFVPLAVFFGVCYLQSGDAVQALADTVNSPFLRLIPLVGWATTAAGALLGGSTAAGALWLLAVAALGAGAVLVLVLSQMDYYEDVLCATESSFEKKRALSEGNINAVTASGTRKTKVRGFGLRGAGANVFLFKHLRESFRENRFGPFSLTSVLLIAGSVGVAAFARGEIPSIAILAMLLWVQVFLVGTGRGLKETYSHYIYLVPAPPFAKLVWSNLEQLVKTVVEGCAIFIPVCILSGEGFVQTLLTVLVYILFVFALIGINYLFMRWTGADLTATLMLLIYFLAVALILGPGAIAAVIIAVVFGNPALALAVLAGWELAAALLCFFGARGILHNCDIQVMRTVK